MPLLANIPFHLVQRGWWMNYTNPPYRQHIWTATNVEALILLGIMGIVGSFASQRSWPVIRHYLQPAVQLPDPSNRLASLSSIKAIQDLRKRSAYFVGELRATWKESITFQERLKNSIQFLRARSNRRLATNHSTIPLRFGLWAVLCLSGFVVLGVFIPYLLGEGLQGAAIVTGTHAILGWHGTISSAIMNINDNMLDRAHADWDRCFGSWRERKWHSYCEDLYNDLPSFDRKEILLEDPAIANVEYQFLTKFGDRNSNATRLSRHTTLQDIGYNARADRKTLYHELTCIPVPLEPFVYQFNGMWQLRVPELVFPEWNDPPRYMEGAMILNTSNSLCPHGAKDMTNSNHAGTNISEEPPQDWAATAKWFQENIDDTLPAIDVRTQRTKFSHRELEYLRADKGTSLMQGMWGPRPETFLITFKFGLRNIASRLIAATSNDSDSAARKQPGCDHVQDREVSALGCVELFRLCAKKYTNEPDCTPLANQPITHVVGHDEPTDSFIDLYYPGIQSVWFASHSDSLYADNPWRVADFYDGRARWQDDVEERFILSMLRTRHASQIAAENDIKLRDGHVTDFYKFDVPLLYHNSDFTNINIVGSIAVFMAYCYIIAGSYWLPLFLPVAFTLKTIFHGLKISGRAVLSSAHLFMRSASIFISSMSNNLGSLLERVSADTFWRSRRSSTTKGIPLGRPLGGSAPARVDEPDIHLGQLAQAEA